MTDSQSIESEQLWRRVGLQELRESLATFEDSKQRFEERLRALPPCETCARASLLGQLRIAGGRLGREMFGIAVLAQVLEDAAKAAQRAQDELASGQLTACRCPEGPCTCHKQT